MEGDTILLVISVLEGRRFPSITTKLLLVEGTFNGESLQSDPVPHESNPKIKTELAWELTKKIFHQHKLQRTPLKLKCFCVDDHTSKKDLMGYVMLDLRMAQNSKPIETVGKWYPLMNSSYQKHKPELNIAITIETEEQYHPIPPQLPVNFSTTSDSGTSHLSLLLDENEGYYVIGPRQQAESIFIVSMLISSVHQLAQVVPVSSEVKAERRYHFYYSLFGNDIHSEPVVDMATNDFQPERASVRFFTSMEMMNLFLAAQQDIKIHFCCDGNTVATTSIPVAHLSKVPEFSEEYLLTSPNTTGRASIVVSVSLVKESPLPPILRPLHGATEPTSVPRGPSPQGPPKDSRLHGQTEGSGIDAVKTQPLKTQNGEILSTAQLQNIREDSTVSHPKSISLAAPPSLSQGLHTSPPPTSTHSARRNLQSSFEEAASKSHSSSQMDSSSTNTSMETANAKTANPQEASSITHKPGPGFSQGPPSSSTQPVMPAEAVFQPTVTCSAPHTAQYIQSVVNSSPLVNQKGNIRSFSKGVSSPSSLGLHHFCYAIDIQSIKNMSHQSTLNCWARYCYPFFGVNSYVVFQPALTIPPLGEQGFTESYCAFDFATTLTSLSNHLISTPLMIEVLSGTAVVGHAQVPLSDVLGEPKVTIQAPGVTGLRQMKTGLVKARSSSKDLPFAEVTVRLVLEDYGPPKKALTHEEHPAISRIGLVQKPQTVHEVDEGRQLEGHGNGSHEDPRTGSQYKAALELELWKEEQEKTFLAQLQEKEEKHLKLLVTEQQKRENERESQLRKKVEEYSRLEKEFKSALSEVRTQQDQLREKEYKVEKAHKDALFEREQYHLKLQQEIQHIKDSYAVQLEMEKSRVNELEMQVKRLIGQLTDGERRYKSLEAEYTSYRESSRQQPESQLQAQLSLLHIEKSELERKLSSVSRSKVHYKQQWSKCLQELAVARQKEQKALKEKMLRQEKTVDELRKSIQVNNDTKDLEKELAEIRQATLKLTEQAASKTSPRTKEVPPATETVDTDVTRLIEERDTLLQTGVYTTNDPTILKLDEEIRNKLTKH